MSKSPITCHVLDSTLGNPAANVRVQLEALSPQNSQFRVLATGATNSDGRCADLIAGQDTKKVLVAKGVYRMTFFTGEYFDKAGRATFYPQVEVSTATQSGVIGDAEILTLPDLLMSTWNADSFPALRQPRSALSHSVVAFTFLLYHLSRLLVFQGAKQSHLGSQQTLYVRHSTSSVLNLAERSSHIQEGSFLASSQQEQRYWEYRDRIGWRYTRATGVLECKL